MGLKFEKYRLGGYGENLTVELDEQEQLIAELKDILQKGGGSGGSGFYLTEENESGGVTYHFTAEESDDGGDVNLCVLQVTENGTYKASEMGGGTIEFNKELKFKDVITAADVEAYIASGATGAEQNGFMYYTLYTRKEGSPIVLMTTQVESGLGFALQFQDDGWIYVSDSLVSLIQGSQPGWNSFAIGDSGLVVGPISGTPVTTFDGTETFSVSLEALSPFFNLAGEPVDGFSEVIVNVPSAEGGGGIIDVETLPTENIDENAVYRTIETVVGKADVYMVGNDGVVMTIADVLAMQGLPAVVTVTLVSELPETMSPAVMSEPMLFPIYILESDGMAYMSMTGSSADAMPFGMFLTGQSGFDKGWSNDINSETEMGIYCAHGEGYSVVHYWNYRDNSWAEFTPMMNVEDLPEENIVMNTVYHVVDDDKYFIRQNDDWLEWSKGPGIAEFISGDGTGTLKLPEGTTKIAPYACYGRKYDTVTLPSTVADIGEYAFSNIPNLWINISNPAGLNVAKEFCDRDACICFGGNVIAGAKGEQYTLNNRGTTYMWSAPEEITALPHLYVRNNIKNVPVIIDDDAATSNTFVESVVISEGITSIGKYAFRYCSNLESITIPNSITKIDRWALEGCSKLAFNEYNNAYYIGNESNPYLVLVQAKSRDITSCEINANTKIICSDAFYQCFSLTSVTVPSSILYIGYRAFESCTHLTFNEYDNACYLGNESNPYLVLVKGKSTDITSCEINANTKIICSKAFLSEFSDDYHDLVSITIPNGVTNICDYAFSGCVGLTSITIPDSVTDIGSGAFRSTSITSIAIPEGITNIADEMFRHCSNLTSVTIPNSVTHISSSVFEYCTELEDIVFKGTKDQWNAITFDYYWADNTGNYTIHCTDGDIAKP